MPEISRFYGIVVAMFHADHPPPHFHLRYGGQKARFRISDMAMLDGDVSPRVRSLVSESANLHREELQRAWDLAAARQPLQPIAPLE